MDAIGSVVLDLALSLVGDKGLRACSRLDGPSKDVPSQFRPEKGIPTPLSSHWRLSSTVFLVFSEFASNTWRAKKKVSAEYFLPKLRLV